VDRHLDLVSKGLLGTVTTKQSEPKSLIAPARGDERPKLLRRRYEGIANAVS